MRIVVLIAGVHDPKWQVSIDEATSGSAAADKRILSPFDEAALEMALRIRDAEPATRIAVRVSGGNGSDRVARMVSALNINDVAIIEFKNPWDQGATVLALAPFCVNADLVLIGREFGDFDDGLVPPYLAALLDLPFFAAAQTVLKDGGIGFARETATHEEIIRADKPILVSVTNDRRTRLRKPLMKNVMMARQVAFETARSADHRSSHLALNGMFISIEERGAGDCQIVEGTVAEKAEKLASFLWEAR